LAGPHITEVTYFKGEQLSTTPLLDETKGGCKMVGWGVTMTLGGTDKSTSFFSPPTLIIIQPKEGLIFLGFGKARQTCEGLETYRCLAPPSHRVRGSQLLYPPPSLQRCFILFIDPIPWDSYEQP